MPNITQPAVPNELFGRKSLTLRWAAVAVVVFALAGCGGGPPDAVAPRVDTPASRAEGAPLASPSAPVRGVPSPDPVSPLAAEILSGRMSATRVAEVELSLFQETDCDVFEAWYRQYSGDSNLRVARQAFAECGILAPAVGREVSRAEVDPETALAVHIARLVGSSSVDDEVVAHALDLARSACEYLRRDSDVEAVARLHWEEGDEGVQEGTAASFVLAARRHLCSDVEIDPHSATSTGTADLTPMSLETECAVGRFEACDLFFAVSPVWSDEAEWAQTCSGTRDVPEVPVACSQMSQLPAVFIPND